MFIFINYDLENSPKKEKLRAKYFLFKKSIRFKFCLLFLIENEVRFDELLQAETEARRQKAAAVSRAEAAERSVKELKEEVAALKVKMTELMASIQGPSNKTE